MDNPRPEKVALVEEVRERLQGSSAAILTEYRGLSVKDISALRRSLRTAGGEYKVYKNTLVRFAVRDLGLGGLEPLLEGPTAIAFVPKGDGAGQPAGDAVGVAKALRDYARTNPALVVKGGVLGTSVLSPADATALADIPPREVLLATFAGGLAAPLRQFAGLLQALPRNMAYGLKALIDKRGGAPEGGDTSDTDTAATDTAANDTADTDTADTDTADTDTADTDTADTDTADTDTADTDTADTDTAAPDTAAPDTGTAVTTDQNQSEE